MDGTQLGGTADGRALGAPLLMFFDPDEEETCLLDVGLGQASFSQRVSELMSGCGECDVGIIEAASTETRPEDLRCQFYILVRVLNKALVPHCD
ncbi:hypothetical protein [Rhodococcus sp. WB9]|uniref:hypothetical protein n=1 Tax=Rhodococcus sp. WB9 TaxID=2594007 RepID=UPI0021B1E680|nr:hypothetical protein [Rhodococcus sp. WB9]